MQLFVCQIFLVSSSLCDLHVSAIFFLQRCTNSLEDIVVQSLVRESHFSGLTQQVSQHFRSWFPRRGSTSPFSPGGSCSHVLHSPQSPVLQILIRGGRRTHSVSALLLVCCLPKLAILPSKPLHKNARPSLRRLPLQIGAALGV